MTKKGKRLYEKPRIKKVKLVPEEAVLQGCKTFSAGAWGANPPRCTLRGGPQCSDQGS
ncbi:MAG: hypothetical protein GTO16_11075 [Candidatus Aminicenantes bacterium]|nr:hypothetical protein [Candidatus Aminicenantes bacterium]